MITVENLGCGLYKYSRLQTDLLSPLKPTQLQHKIKIMCISESHSEIGDLNVNV